VSRAAGSDGAIDNDVIVGLQGQVGIADGRLRDRPADSNVITQQVEVGERRLPGERARSQIACVGAAHIHRRRVHRVHDGLRDLQRPCPAGEADAGAWGDGREGDGAGGLGSSSGSPA